MNEALDKAVEVFWEMGYEAADTETLCSRMGLTKPSIYNSFGSKEELFLKSVRRYKETFSGKHVEVLMSGKTPEEGLNAYFTAVAKDVCGHHHPSGCMIACVVIPISERITRVTSAMREASTTGPSCFVKFFAAAAENGTLSISFDISAAVALLQDLVLAMGVLGRSGISLEALEQRAIRNAELVMLEGERNQP